jgi:hypothetical protein
MRPLTSLGRSPSSELASISGLRLRIAKILPAAARPLLNADRDGAACPNEKAARTTEKKTSTMSPPLTQSPVTVQPHAQPEQAHTSASLPNVKLSGYPPVMHRSCSASWGVTTWPTVQYCAYRSPEEELGGTRAAADSLSPITSVEPYQL